MFINPKRQHVFPPKKVGDYLDYLAVDWNEENRKASQAEVK